MPVRNRVVPELNLIYYAGFSHCTGEELLAAEAAGSKDPGRVPDMRIIIDYSMVTELDIDQQDIQTLIELNRRLLAQGRLPEMTALIARDEYDFSLADVFALLAGDSVPLRLAAFHTLRQALEWLGLADAETEVRAVRRSLQDEATAERATGRQTGTNV